MWLSLPRPYMTDSIRNICSGPTLTSMRRTGIAATTITLNSCIQTLRSHISKRYSTRATESQFSGIRMVDMRGGMFTSLSGDWRTPKELYEQLDREFHFDFDPCPTDWNGSWDGLT